MTKKLSYDQKIYFRNLFRDARAKALNNSENFEDIIFALENLGKVLTGKEMSLGRYKDEIYDLAKQSVLADKIPEASPAFHTNFCSQFDLVKNERNSAMHEGVFARHLTQHAIEISLILEDALMKGEREVKDYMVRNPICAYDWQPISFIRQNMLANSFSYLPIFYKEEWRLISDLEISRYIQESKDDKDRRERLSICFYKSGIEPTKTKNVNAKESIDKVMKDWKGLPVCVTVENSSKEIVGILTPFDLL